MANAISTDRLAEDAKTYNYRILRLRMVVENVFGRLKGRWRCLIKSCDMTVDKVPNIIAACCVLHNVCELYQEGYDERWSETETGNREHATAK